MKGVDMNKWLKTMIPAALSVLTASVTLAQLPSPSRGINFGNAMEATCGVGCWGTPPSQAMVNAVAAAGFNTVRLPCAWMTHSNRKGTIDATYMAQVQQLVDWCVAKGLYVVINDHWDNGWFENDKFSSYSSRLNSKMQTMWTQIANQFKNYDGHVLFACANEPNASTAAQTAVLYQYFQNWVTYVRATGGNNATRWLIVQAPSASIDNATNWVTMPTDPAHRVMLEAHFYDPYQFSQMEGDQSWGAMYYFWGAAYHTTGLANRNAAWGEEDYQNAELDKARAFVDRGYPVLCGEWRAAPKRSEPDLTGQYIDQNVRSCSYWNYFMQAAMNSRGLYGTAWDTPGETFDPNTGAILDQASVDALTGKSCLPPISGL
jgi:aryl-phospho-beta-D-glucosidase BglC (GH1 family)